jgi:hypothetical protein
MKDLKHLIRDFIGEKVYYDPYGGGYIWGKQKNSNGSQMIAQVEDVEEGNPVVSIRGWGAIQHLKNLPCSPEELQDELGRFIANAINDKLKEPILLKEITKGAIIKLVELAVNNKDEIVSDIKVKYQPHIKRHYKETCESWIASWEGYFLEDTTAKYSLELFASWNVALTYNYRGEFGILPLSNQIKFYELLNQIRHGN